MQTITETFITLEVKVSIFTDKM